MVCSWSEGVTHVVAPALVRNRKIVAAMAAGNWLLHTSYLDACRQAGCLVSEVSACEITLAHLPVLRNSLQLKRHSRSMTQMSSPRRSSPARLSGPHPTTRAEASCICLLISVQGVFC